MKPSFMCYIFIGTAMQSALVLLQRPLLTLYLSLWVWISSHFSSCSCISCLELFTSFGVSAICSDSRMSEAQDNCWQSSRISRSGMISFKQVKKLCVNIKHLNLTRHKETKEWNNASSSAKARVSWSFPNGIAQTIWFSNRNFWFPSINGKYPKSHQCRKKGL